MEPSLRNQLHSQKEGTNDKNRYAIAVVDDGVVVGHIPRKISLVCSLCIKRGGIIECKVTDRGRYSADLLYTSVGYEVPLVGLKKLYKSLLIERWCCIDTYTHTHAHAYRIFLVTHFR